MSIVIVAASCASGFALVIILLSIVCAVRCRHHRHRHQRHSRRHFRSPDDRADAADDERSAVVISDMTAGLKHSLPVGTGGDDGHLLADYRELSGGGSTGKGGVRTNCSAELTMTVLTTSLIDSDECHQHQLLQQQPSTYDRYLPPPPPAPPLNGGSTTTTSRRRPDVTSSRTSTDCDEDVKRPQAPAAATANGFCKTMPRCYQQLTGNGLREVGLNDSTNTSTALCRHIVVTVTPVCLYLTTEKYCSKCLWIL